MPFYRVLLFSVVLSLPATAADLPSNVLPAGVGVNIHFTTGHRRDLDRIAAAGFKYVRMDFEWGAIEVSQKGVYHWSAYDTLTRELERRGLRAIYILAYSNPLYEKPAKAFPSPQHPESIAAYARWAAMAARRYHGRHIIWEIWNEPNISFWRPRPDVQQYTRLALATCRAVRVAEPNATLVAPATSGVPLDYLEKFFASGVLAYLDAVSLHPYRAYDRPPEDAAHDYQNVRRLIRRYAPAGKKDLPIISSEWGYSSHTQGVTPQTQAAYLVRMQLANLLDGVRLSIWYDWKDDGANPAEGEQNFGTVHNDLRPKPAYQAVRTLTHELAGYHIVRRIDVGNQQDYVLLLENGPADRKLAVWTLGKSHTVALPVDLGSSRATGVTGNGEPLKLKRAKGVLILEATGLPSYLEVSRAEHGASVRVEE